MTHHRAVALMILATLLWSIAGVVTRHLDSPRSFEVTFWRSLFNALALAIILSATRGAAAWRRRSWAQWPLWASGVCWSIMYTAFMLALTLTSVANVLVTLAVGPLVTAIFARLFLGRRLPARTWGAIMVASSAIAWMFGQDAAAGSSLLGSFVALASPLAAAGNWTLLQAVAAGKIGAPTEASPDMLPAVLIGATLSALATGPFALPFAASLHDLSWLALLGVVQLALPCLIVVRLARELPAEEIALLGLLEIVFGVTWAWLGAGERPAAHVLLGGTLVIATLALHARAKGEG